ncbi:NACHT domain protein, partial [Aspergillus sclerotialis]
MERPGGRLVQHFGNSEATNGAFSFQGNVYGNIQISYSRDRPLELFDSLPEAAFNAASKDHSPSCLENTRRNVLEQIENWADSDGERRIYWLKGMAGIGKSTIALTVARKYARLGRLGASFFFSRGDGDLASAKKFATAIAAQLADALPELRSLIEDAITSNTEIHHLGLYEQWQKLVLESLRQLGGNKYPHSIVVVIDALDECDNEDDVSLLIQCLAAATVVEGMRLRVFVTSRPEQPTNIGFDSISRDLHQDFILHDIEQSIIDQDLVLFYKGRLARIAKKFGLSDHLLSDETVQSLVRKSNGLFIHAATVCRFIEEGGQLAGERLSVVVAARGTPSKPEKELDQMYTTVLIHSLPTQLETEELTKVQALFRLIVGSIVVLSEAMRPPDLAVVVEEPTDVVLSTLHRLHSLLDVRGENRPIRLLHPSLRDFLLDPARCQNKTFLVDAQAVHFRLFNCCLRLMKNHLRRNICRIERPGTRACDIPKSTVEKYISLPLQYACRYWIYHLQQSGIDPNDSLGIMDFFQTRFIHWLETLALIGRLSEGITMIRWLEAKLAVSSTALNLKGDNLIKLRSMLSRMEGKLRRKPIYTASASHRSTNSLYPTVYDAMRFVLSHSAIIEEAPLQLYCSALLFSPEKSIIRTHHSDEIPKWILCRPKTLEDWSPYLQTLIGHSDW